MFSLSTSQASPAGWTLLAQGAEARVYLAPNVVPGDALSIVKERFEKKYRHTELDAKLTKQRFNGEVKAMVKAARAGVDIPRLDFVDRNQKRIIMEYVHGRTMKAFFEDPLVEHSEKLRYARLMGSTVARMHEAGLIHGDLTTSNMLIRQNATDELTAIDFGLSFFSKSAEDMGVDLYVLQRAFLSTHPNSEDLFDQVLAGYVSGCSHGDVVTNHFNQIQLRGRKRVAFG